MLVGLELMPEQELTTLYEALYSDLAPLAPSVTPMSSPGFASAMFGTNRTDPNDMSGEMFLGLSCLAELVASPRFSTDSRALHLLTILCRSRWRDRGMVRDPRKPEELLTLAIDGIPEPE